MSIGLRARAALLVLALLLSFFLIALFAAGRAAEALANVERARFDSATRQLADTAGYAVLARSEALLTPTLEAFARSPDVVKVVVRDDAGALLAQRTGPQGTTRPSTEITVPVHTRMAAPGDEGELLAFGIQSAGVRTVGSIQASFSSAALPELIARSRRAVMVPVAVGGGFGLLAVLLLSGSVVQRVRLIAAAARRVRHGQLDVTVDASGRDELSSLARDFNTMVQALAEQKVRLDNTAQVLAERESLAAIGRATAIIAHELRNPMGIVLGAAQIVANEHKPMFARAQAAAIVEAEARRLSTVLDDLLTFARPRAPERTDVDVAALVDRVIDRARLPGGPAGGAMLAASGEAAHALADETQVERVLWNLLQNACQAGARRVSVVTSVTGDVVSIRVMDDGPGIDPGIRSQLFLPFATTKQRGTGLGLAASRQVARNHGGDLALLATEKGTCFEVTLPAPARTTTQKNTETKNP